MQEGRAPRRLLREWFRRARSGCCGSLEASPGRTGALCQGEAANFPSSLEYGDGEDIAGRKECSYYRSVVELVTGTSRFSSSHLGSSACEESHLVTSNAVLDPFWHQWRRSGGVRYQEIVQQ